MDSLATIGTSFSFLTSGPAFSLELPDYFEAIPELNAPLFNGIGGRDFTFFPADRDQRADDSVFLRPLSDRDGREVELYRRVDDPPLWWLRWPLGAGALYTHLREEDGEQLAEATVKGISLVENNLGVPFLLPYPPMIFDMSGPHAVEEEAAYYSKTKGPSWSVTLRRPGFVALGDRLVAPLEDTGGVAVVRAGLGSGVEALVIAGNDVEECFTLADVVTSSFAEL
jgi:hypothetical protein